MSGFEIAGVVLGLFPIVCDSAKDLRGVFRDAQTWWRFEREFEDFILEIEKQQIAFSQILEILFDPLDQISHRDRETLASDPSSPLWYDLHIQRTLTHRVGQKYLGWFMRRLSDLNDSLEELLGPDLKVLFNNGTDIKHVKIEIEAEAKSSDSENFSPHSRGTTIQDNVEDLRHQVSTKNMSKKLREQGPKSIVKLLSSTLSTLSNPANAKTGSNYEKGLERPTEKLQKKGIKHQTGGGQHELRASRVRFDTPPQPLIATSALPSETSRCNQEIKDVCLAIKKYGQEPCLGFLKLPGKNIFLHLDPPGQTQVPQSQTLEEFINATPRRAPRLQLGMAIAIAVLKLGPSWIPENWHKSTMVLLQIPGPVPQPYISHLSIHTPLKSASLTEVSKTKATLLSLGIMLLELLFGDTLERQPFRADYLGNGGVPNDMTDFCTAMRWQKKVEEDFGDKLAQAIESCVKCAFEPVADLHSLAFVQAVWTTVMRTWFGRGKKLQRAVTSCCLCAFVLYGYDQGVFGGILENQDWLRQFNDPGDTLTGFITSSYNLGCLLGCFKNFFVGEKLGRRWTIWVAMGWILIGAALQATAFTRGHLIVGRIVTGVGTGLKTSTVPMYQSELCEGTKRGRLVSAEVMFVGIGIAFAYWWDFAFSFVGGPFAWRWPLAFQAIFAFWVIFVVFGVPESPRWLLNHGKREEAVGVLSAVYDKPIDHPDILREVASIEAALSMEAEAEGSTSWTSIFRKDKVSTRYRIFLAWFVQFMNQVGGINLVVYYILTVLTTNVGLEHRLAQIIAGCIQLMFPIGSLLPTLALDKMGRRSTMMWGSAGLSFSMMMVAALLSQADDTSRGRAFAAGSVAFFFTYMLVFGARTAIGVSSNWLWNFTVVMITPILINRLQWKAYLIFMATNLAFVPIIFFLYPETSNLALEEVDYIFARGENTVQVAREMQKELALHGRLADDRHSEKATKVASMSHEIGDEFVEHAHT
ncbi:sugar transporter STL1 [Fusarium beomiforme]|uniref:Sugar transporter STL1 n=1 Tax=Fusarium beomiforme TaxID=44412 RepID=A0A9P5DTS1_9HYPO|nr:sugar transporter STL1 [Fusarium beomiforme]